MTKPKEKPSKEELFEFLYPFFLEAAKEAGATIFDRIWDDEIEGLSVFRVQPLKTDEAALYLVGPAHRGTHEWNLEEVRGGFRPGAGLMVDASLIASDNMAEIPEGVWRRIEADLAEQAKGRQ
jgi:hypothetical protein